MLLSPAVGKGEGVLRLGGNGVADLGQQPGALIRTTTRSPIVLDIEYTPWCVSLFLFDLLTIKVVQYLS